MRLPDAVTTFIRDEDGAELVEFALCLTVLLVCIFATLDGARLVYFDHYVGNAARDGSRYAMVRGSTWAGTSCATTSTYKCAAAAADVKAFILSASPSVTSTTPITVTTTWPGTTAAGAACDTSSGANSPGCVVKVLVTYQFVPMVPFIPTRAIVLSSSSQITVSL